MDFPVKSWQGEKGYCMMLASIFLSNSQIILE